jgi:asparagine synthase (glutamine-hydrolysing)
MMKEVFGDRITLITGDGGDKVLRDIRPAGRIENIDALVNYVLNHNQLMPLDVVSALTGLDARDNVGSLRRHLQSYDEEDMISKYVHFLVGERCMKWNFQGEDRNRFAFWPVAPIFATPLFVRAMNVPFGLKSRYKLFREMLLLFSPEAAHIKNALWDLPVTSRKLWFYFSAREAYLRLPPRMRRLVRSHRGHGGGVSAYPIESGVVTCFSGQLKNCSAISEYLSVDAVRSNLPRISKMGFDHLFTLTSMIEDFTSSKSTIESYSERELI